MSKESRKLILSMSLRANTIWGLTIMSLFSLSASLVHADSKLTSSQRSKVKTYTCSGKTGGRYSCQALQGTLQVVYKCGNVLCLASGNKLVSRGDGTFCKRSQSFCNGKPAPKNITKAPPGKKGNRLDWSKIKTYTCRGKGGGRFSCLGYRQGALFSVFKTGSTHKIAWQNRLFSCGDGTFRKQKGGGSCN